MNISHPEMGQDILGSFTHHPGSNINLVDSKNIQTEVDREGKQDRSWCRTTVYTGTAVLQPSGIVSIAHKGALDELVS